MTAKLRLCVLLIAILACLSATTTAGQEDNSRRESPRYAIVIHGGAGAAPKTQQWRQSRKTVLEQALTTGETMLAAGESSLDTVEAVVRLLENSPFFNAGKGAVFNSVGEHQLDATIMDGRDRSAGAVGGVTTIKNPISLARRVMTHTSHVLLVTDGAERFADGFDRDAQIQRVPNEYFSTPQQRKKLERTKAAQKQPDSDAMGTVGCVALDTHGNIAAATSTGGMNNKKYGRLGDSPIAGAGTFADNATCGVSCTGVGEDYIRNAVAYDVSARMAYRGDSLEKSVADILGGQAHQVRGGIIGVNRTGQITMQFNTAGMARAAADSNGRHEVHVAE